MAQDLVTVNEAMRALGMSRSTLWRRLRSGDISSVRRHGRRLVRLTSARPATVAARTADIAPFTKQHPMFRLVGAGRSGGHLPGARDKHAILDA